MIEKTDKENLINRPPVVTVMGHVDHGKTGLLDTNQKIQDCIWRGGGITQHIGAYQVEVQHDLKAETHLFGYTGHEAFTAMRARGTRVTDIAVLVVFE